MGHIDKAVNVRMTPGQKAGLVGYYDVPAASGNDTIFVAVRFDVVDIMQPRSSVEPERRYLVIIEVQVDAQDDRWVPVLQERGYVDNLDPIPVALYARKNRITVIPEGDLGTFDVTILAPSNVGLRAS